MKYLASFSAPLLVIPFLPTLPDMPAVNTADGKAQVIDLLSAPGVDELDGIQVTPTAGQADPFSVTVRNASAQGTLFDLLLDVSVTEEGDALASDAPEGEPGELEPTGDSDTGENNAPAVDSETTVAGGDGEPESEEPGDDGTTSPASPDGAVEDEETEQPGASEDPDGDGEPSALRDTGPGYEVVTAPLETDEFLVAGVVWTGENPDQVDIRVLEDRQWTDWYTLDVEKGDEGTPGTEAFITSGATGIQVRLTGSTVPTSLDLALTSGGAEEAELATPEESAIEPGAGSLSDPAVNDVATDDFFVPQEGEVTQASYTPAPQVQSILGTSVAAPRIVSRSGWGMERVPRAWKPSYVELRGAVIHHTAGTNNYTEDKAPQIVRSVHDYHTYSWGRGWDDIGYNYLVDKYGNIYEGRYGTQLSGPGKMVIGGHAAPANRGSVGISVMGTYTGSVQPTSTILTALEDVIAWQFSRAGISATDTWTYVDRSGVTRRVPAIIGHRDVSNTTCPGNIYQHLDRIRNGVQRRESNQWSWSRPNVGAVKIYKTDDFSPRSTNVQHFGARNHEIYSGNVLGRGDLPFARSGNRFYFADSASSPTTVTEVQLGSSTQEVYVGDLNGSGRDSVILRTGNRFDIYDDVTVNRPTRSINFGRRGDDVFVFDWDGDGKDEIAVRRGNKFYLKWTTESGNADRVIGYGRVGDEVYVGNWNNGRYDTITVRRGNTYYMSYSIRSGWADRKFNYGRATDEVIVGDWNRDGRDGVAVVRRP